MSLRSVGLILIHAYPHIPTPAGERQRRAVLGDAHVDKGQSSLCPAAMLENPMEMDVAANFQTLFDYSYCARCL